MRKTLMSIILGLVLSAVPIAIYANNAACAPVKGCTIAGPEQCETYPDGSKVCVCAYICP